MIRILLTASLLLLAACGDPLAVRQPPETARMVLFMILSPDVSSQPMLVQPAFAAGPVEDITGEVWDGEKPIAPGAPSEEFEGNELWPCYSINHGGFSGTGGEPRCLVFDFTPQYGATYQISVSADDRPTARATVTVPGDFEVQTVTAEGDPPGTEGLKVTWTRSEGAYRYLVGLRATTPPWDCGPNCGAYPDRQGWFAVTTDTVLNTVVAGKGAEELGGAKGPWYVDVYAVDRALYEYLTTGSDANLYPVPPAQNVERGYGAVGSWVRRSLEIEPPK